MANVSFSLPSELTPNVIKQASYTNYLNFHSGNGNPVTDWAQQYLPELYNQEVERYGNRSISSFLRMVGAEMPMASDQVIWSEQGKADAIKTMTAEAKNINMDPRKTADGIVEAGGIKVRALSGDNSSKLKLKLKNY